MLVEINVGGASVKVQAPDEGVGLSEVAAAALDLWEITQGKTPTSAGPAVGFTSQVATPPARSRDMRRAGEISPVRA